MASPTASTVKTTDWVPKTLKGKLSADEFKDWVEEMKAYKNCTTLANAKADTQKYMFNKFIDTDFWNKVKIQLQIEEKKENPAIVDFDECLRVVEMVFGAGNSKYLRREEWFKATSLGSKESVSVFIARCKRAVEYGELENMKADEILAHRLMTVVNSEVKKEVLLQNDEPDLQSILKVLRRYEAKQNQYKREKELVNNQVANVTYKSDIKEVPEERRKPKKLECWICSGEHMKFDCPTNGEVGLCDFCSKPGHVEKVCLAKKR